MSTTQASVRIQAPAGAWETLGVDRARGVVPENIQLTSTDQGPDTASFDLRRDPGVPWPDLATLAPVEIQIGGVTVWDGFISQTPTRDGAEDVVSVQCRGWQYYLDEDSFSRNYLHTDMSAWQDIRSLSVSDPLRADSGPDLTVYTGGWVVESGAAPSITWPGSAGTAPWSTNMGGIGMDFGESGVQRLAIVWDHGGDGNGVLGVDASNASFRYGSLYGSTDAYSTTVGMAVYPQQNKLTIFTFPSPRRYVLLTYQRTAPFTFPGDIFIKFRSILAGSLSGNIDGSTGQSALVASTIVSSAIDRNAPLLSADKSLITPSSFIIPSFAFNEGRTTREVITALNAFHDWQIGVAVGRRPMFRPRPSVPTYQVGNWGGSEFSDASAGDASAIYDRCVVEGQDVAGGQVSVPVMLPSQVAAYAPTSAAISNPNFTVDTSGWTFLDASEGSFLRDTGTYSTSPASAKMTVDIHGDVNVETPITAPSGGWVQGKTYAIQIDLRGTISDRSPVVQVYNDTTKRRVGLIVATAPNGAWRTNVLAFQPELDDAGAASLKLRITDFTPWNATFSQGVWIDNIKFMEARPSAYSRWGRRHTQRLQVSNPINLVTAQRIGETFIAGHQQTPLKGDVSAAYGGIRDMDSRAVHPSLLLLETGGVLQLSDRVDPDTGAVGRLGQIASVSYDHSNETAQISLDNQRNRIESFLERLAVVTGAALQR